MPEFQPSPPPHHSGSQAAPISRLRRWLYSGYALALALGIGLLAAVYVFGNQLVGQTVGLARDELPALDRLYVARTAVQEYQTVLFEYYATGDRQRFAALSELCDGRIRAAIEGLPQTAAGDGLADTLTYGHAELFALGSQLDGLLSGPEHGASVDNERARELLSSATAIAQRLHTAMEAAIRPVAARASARGDAASGVLGRLVGTSLGLGAAILLMSLAIGYLANAYLRERVERVRLATFPERNPNPVLAVDCDARVVYANPGAHRWLATHAGPDETPASFLPADLGARLAAVRADASGYAYWEHAHATAAGPRIFGCGVHYLDDFCEFHLFMTDITERKAAEQQLRHQARHDVLTGLPNRRTFEAEIERQLQAPVVVPFSLLFVSVDRFSNVVQGLGHAIADQVLVAIAARLQTLIEALASGAQVFRFEGPLFSVLLPGIDSPAREVRVADLLAGLAGPIEHNGREHFFSYTLGGTTYPTDGTDTASLLKNVDSALQAASRRGAGNHAWYQPAMNQRAAQRLTLESGLRHAVERGELLLHYQPQLDLANGRIFGAEALLRWQPAGQALISPGDFIPIAEESGLIVPIGEWVMREACRRNQAWRAAGHDELIVAVNVSAQQFLRPGFPDLVRRVLADTGLPARLLELEVTESVAMDDVEATIGTLQSLKDIGVHLSIDDFGTGYSSLSYLKRFPIDKLKVDQSFVRHMVDEPDATAIARAVIDLGHSLRLRVIAEGVETEAQLTLLRQFGCHEMQGYLYSRPVPADAFAALLAEARPLPAASLAAVPVS